MLRTRLLDYLHADAIPGKWSCLHERADNERPRYIANNERHTGLLQGEVARKLPRVSSTVKGLALFVREITLFLDRALDLALNATRSEYAIEWDTKELRGASGYVLSSFSSLLLPLFLLSPISLPFVRLMDRRKVGKREEWPRVVVGCRVQRGWESWLEFDGGRLTENSDYQDIDIGLIDADPPTFARLWIYYRYITGIQSMTNWFFIRVIFLRAGDSDTNAVGGILSHQIRFTIHNLDIEARYCTWDCVIRRHWG